MTDFDEQRIQNQFGGFCTKVLKREARCIQREYAKTRELEKSFGELSELEFYGLSAYDEYFKADHVFDVLGTPVVVNSDFLAQAISNSPIPPAKKIASLSFSRSFLIASATFSHFIPKTSLCPANVHLNIKSPYYYFILNNNKV